MKSGDAGLRTFVRRLELSLRSFIVYPLLSRILRTKTVGKTIDLNHVNRILLLRYDRIGDSIVTTPVYRKLKQAHRAVQLGVFVSPVNEELVRNNPHVDDVFIFYRNPIRLIRELRRARRKKFEVLVNFIFNRTTTVALIARFLCPKGITVSQGDPKYAFYFNRFLTLPRGQLHMTELLAQYMTEVFGITFSSEELEYELPVDAEAHSFVDAYLRSHGLMRRNRAASVDAPYVVFNISSTDRERSISNHQASLIIDIIARNHSMHLVVISAPHENERRSHVVRGANSARCHPYPPAGSSTLIAVASLLEGALCVITPDTGIVHVAAATKTPVLGFFTPLQSPVEWSPFRVLFDMVLSGPNQPVSSISDEQIISSVNKFLKEVSLQGITDVGDGQAGRTRGPGVDKR